MRVLIGDPPVAVTAFKAVYTLELTRRSNDQKVIALYAEYVARFISITFPSLIDTQDERYDGDPNSVCPPVDPAPLT